jgi:hypothetical protein
MDRPRVYGFSGYRLLYNIVENPCFVNATNSESRGVGE